MHITHSTHKTVLLFLFFLFPPQIFISYRRYYNKLPLVLSVLLLLLLLPLFQLFCMPCCVRCAVEYSNVWPHCILFPSLFHFQLHTIARFRLLHATVYIRFNAHILILFANFIGILILEMARDPDS